MTNNPRILVYISAGDNQKSLKWLSEQTCQFDLAIFWYGTKNQTPEINTRYFLEGHGFKIPNFLKMIHNFPEMLTYDYYFFIDDDILASKTLIEDWLKLIQKYQLDSSQPSYSPESAHYWPHLIQNLKKRIAFNEMVEVGCFALSRRLFEIAFPYFKFINSGYGLDLAIFKLCKRHKFRTGVLHELTIIHPTRDESGTVRRKISNFTKEGELIIKNLEENLGSLNFYNLSQASRLTGSTSVVGLYLVYPVRGVRLLKHLCKKIFSIINRF